MAASLLAGLPASAEIAGGTRNPAPAGDQSALIAAAKAEFPSVLARALSSESIAAMVKIIKEAPSTGPGLTDFDNVSAPCDFDGTTALRGVEQFASFNAPGTSGGAILNECSNFGVEAYSPPNFLAFNRTLTYTAGGVPKTPELILVGPNRSTVTFYASGGARSGYPLGIVALNSSGVIGMQTITTSSTWVQVTVTGTGIAAIGLVGDPYWLVVDNIQAQ
jgi:hypothetical protein